MQELLQRLAVVPAEERAKFIESLDEEEVFELEKLTEKLADFIARVSPGLAAPLHLQPLLDLLEATTEGPQRATVSTPPQHGKTQTCMHALIWLLRRDPTKRHAYATYEATKAERNNEELQQIATRASLPWSGNRTAWKTPDRGGVVAAGIGGPLTGEPVDGVLLIDDPVKNFVDANSSLIRERTDEWFKTVARTRVHPGASIIVVQCMVGGTLVLMGDGTEKALRDVRAGDVIATHNNGRISTSVVKNWANQGPDYVFKIRTRSGSVVLANGRHPFLAERDGVRKWLRLREIRAGDHLVRATGANGRESSALSMGAVNPSAARVSARLTTVKTDGVEESERHPLTPTPAETLTFDTGTESTSKSTEPCSRNREAGALCAENRPARTCVRTGVESFASITATEPTASGGFSATTATSLSPTGRPRRCCSRPLSTYALIPDVVEAIEDAGREDVFDIEVEGTENFIANGLVSHNTRWHEDDLSGRLIKRPGWKQINLKAIGDNGLALWPQGRPLDFLNEVRADVGEYNWSSLYQGEPRPRGGAVFGDATYYKTIPDDLLYRVGIGVDLAYTKTTVADWSVVVTMLRVTRPGVIKTPPLFYILDVQRKQVPAPEFKATLRAAHNEHPSAPMRWYAAGTEKGISDFIQAKDDDLPGVPLQVKAPRGDKFVRAQPAAAAWNKGRILLPENAPWASVFVGEVCSFTGVNDAHDDQVDALAAAFDELASGWSMAGDLDKYPGNVPRDQRATETPGGTHEQWSKPSSHATDADKPKRGRW